MLLEELSCTDGVGQLLGGSLMTRKPNEIEIRYFGGYVALMIPV